MNTPRTLDRIDSHIQDVLKLAARVGLENQGYQLSTVSENEFALSVQDKSWRICLVDEVSCHHVDESVLGESSNTILVSFEFKSDWFNSFVGTELLGSSAVINFGRGNEGDLDRWFESPGYREASLDNCNPGESLSLLANLMACLCLDFPIEDCVVLSRALENVSRETWPLDCESFPLPKLDLGKNMTLPEVAFPRHNLKCEGLYPVVDNVDLIEELLENDLSVVQLRIKTPELPDLETQIKRAIELGETANAQVYINDHWQLALKHGAYGVHLGQEDIDETDLNLLAKSGIRLGLSTHGYYELLRITQLDPSYIALGHIFPTTTKVMPSKPQGLIRLGLYDRLVKSVANARGKSIPTVAIGGIDLDRVPKVVSQGVDYVAVVRAVTLAEDKSLAVEELNNAISESKQKVH